MHHDIRLQGVKIFLLHLTEGTSNVENQTWDFLNMKQVCNHSTIYLKMILTSDFINSQSSWITSRTHFKTSAASRDSKLQLTVQAKQCYGNPKILQVALKSQIQLHCTNTVHSSSISPSLYINLLPTYLSLESYKTMKYIQKLSLLYYINILLNTGHRNHTFFFTFVEWD